VTQRSYGASAVITLSLRVRGKSHWGGSATISEVQRIGGEELVNAIKAALVVAKIDFDIVSKPSIGMITWEPEE